MPHMLEQIGDRVRQGLKGWTYKMMGHDGEHRMQAIARTENEYGVDPFGFSLDFAMSAIAPFLFLYRHYFRVEAHGIEKVPKGRVLLVSNHSGQLPIDGAMIGVALLAEGNPPRALRAMVEKWMPTLPYVSTFMARIGQIVGTAENCRRLLMADEVILVFPEGVRGLGKLWPQRYHLQDFGLGFMRLALETDTPIVPVGVIGAEEQAPGIASLKPVANLFGFPYLNLTPTGVPFPLPTKYHIYFGDPMRFTGRPDDEDAELEKKVNTVKATLQAMLDGGLKERQHVFW
jgi:1-acyl-sn-glycerol-3-phosphate acyltransferase